MTTKIKILGGFLIMIMLIAVLAVTSYVSTRSSSENFLSYRMRSRADLNLGSMLFSIQRMYTNFYSYLRWRDEKYMAEAAKALDEVERAGNLTVEIFPDEAHKNKVKEILQETQLLRPLINSVKQSLTSFYHAYQSNALPGEKKMLEAFTIMASQTRAEGNTEALFHVFGLMDNFNDATSAMSHYVNSRDPDKLAVTKKNISLLKAEADTLKDLLRTPEGLRAHATVIEGIKHLFSLCDEMETLATNAREAFADIEKKMTTVIADMQEFSNITTRERSESGNSIEQTNTNSMRSSLIMGVCGLLLGVACAVILTLGIMRTLKELATFALAVSHGNFDYKIKSKEKGEVGTVIESLRAIPVVLGKIIEAAGSLSGQIKAGQLRNRLETSSFNGAFAEIAVAFNTVSETYTKLIDGLPVPIMACDPKHNIVFLSTVAQNTMGGNHVGKICSDQLRAAECPTENCLGNRAMGSNAAVTAEVTVYPKGNKMIAAVTATPLHSQEGDIVGYFEVLNDITAIREQEQTMRRVADEASSIANRVAAASEQLSTQVEQISHGAGVQRDRVESTATAMAQMNATVLEVARNAGQASEQSEKAKDKAHDGANLVNQVVHSINSINTVAVTLQNNMQELGDQAESIGGVMNVISDIADQTNLLALNAAIEAARAGEAGRGFAVVADEVRKLAEKTMSATHEVGSSIKAIQHSTRVNIDEVGNAVRSINEANELANSSGEALSEIVELSSVNSSVVASIATAAEEQSATSEEIHRAIDEINGIVGETTEGMIQSSAAVQDLSQMAHDLNRTMEALK